MDWKLGGLALLLPLSAMAQDCDQSPWHSSERVDSMTDARTCVVSNAGSSPAPIMVFIEPRSASISIIGNQYPGSKSAIRVDSNKPYTVIGDDSVQGDDARKLLSEMAAGSRIRTKYYQWPSHISKEGDFPVCDVVEKVLACLERVE